MYMGIGFLVAALIGVAVVSLVHDRAVRLTMRRLQGALQQSMVEIQADKDLLRAEFAMSTRRLELNLERIKRTSATQLVELSKRYDVINRLKFQRDALKVEVIALNAEIAALRKPPAVQGRVGSRRSQCRVPCAAVDSSESSPLTFRASQVQVAALWAEEFASAFLGGGNETVSSKMDLMSEFSDRYLWYCVTTALASFRVASLH